MYKIMFIVIVIVSTLQSYTNNLINEDSPYLLQHAHNPVNWYPWGDEAFLKAKKEDKLIFLSIGYSTCHWCHVMERESFENVQVANILNKNFVSIKVDREEFPHIDRYYQDIYMLINKRSGGWPLTIVMTPNKEVFFTATYLPSGDNFSKMGLKSILKKLAKLYKKDKDKVLKRANFVKKMLATYKNSSSINEKANIDNDIEKRYLDGIKKIYDYDNKGIGVSPKFPHATTFSTLLDIYRLTKEKDAYTLTNQALLAMANGGIYDQIEGGFYRYSVDEMWMIPHFEKMLYINAELLETYIDMYRLNKDKKLKEVIVDTISNIDERFKNQNLYYSASDADSDGKEGEYFLFDYKEALKGLQEGGFSKEKSKYILDYFSIYEDGNFEGKKTNPYLGGMDAPKDIKKAKMILKQIRSKRSYPFIDHKIQTSWNALFLSSLFKAGRYIDHDYTKEAIKSLDILIDKLYVNKILYHQVVSDKKPKVKAYLEDYSFLIMALIEAYEVDFEKRYLDLASNLINEAVIKFYTNKTWYMSNDKFKSRAEFYDASYRSALAVMFENMFKVAILTDNNKLDLFAKESLNIYLSKFSNQIVNYPYGLRVFLESKYQFTVIKSKKPNLLANIDKLNSINYPYILFKPTRDEKFLACKIDRCFGIDQNLSNLLKNIK